MGNVPRLLLAKMGGILGFAMEMTRRRSIAIPKPEIPNRNPRRLETRTQRGFPHSHSDGGCGRFSAMNINPAKIADLVRFLHRTLNGLVWSWLKPALFSLFPNGYKSPTVLTKAHCATLSPVRLPIPSLSRISILRFTGNDCQPDYGCSENSSDS